MNSLEFIRIVAEPTRLRIINILLNGKVCELMLKDLIQEEDVLFEKAMNQLKKYNIILIKKINNTVYYSLTNKALEHINTIQNLLGELCTDPVYNKDRKSIYTFKKECGKNNDE